MTDATRETFEGWAIVELMGHRMLAGYVREAQVFGATMLRLDVHVGGPPRLPDPPDTAVATQYYGGQAVYCVTPTTEEYARHLAATHRPAPVARWQLPAAAPDGDVDEVEEPIS